MPPARTHLAQWAWLSGEDGGGVQLLAQPQRRLHVHGGQCHIERSVILPVAQVACGRRAKGQGLGVAHMANSATLNAAL